ncbi:hypothetical protein CAPTEDRAFT_195367 [Capitella teleta]|uniref:Uncharacterized protein n=1 Tax=Capitella teleta TaxID=283909 RepID=R7V8I9_CAPTE|nr:hypothetical protein CAPTEDRAFT_195367 [Capitella teleta]|eukprot:ELU15158.1 hypothetical protein CAPTEDRAFT_195367 [Capitella teleta]
MRYYHGNTWGREPLKTIKGEIVTLSWVPYLGLRIAQDSVHITCHSKQLPFQLKFNNCIRQPQESPLFLGRLPCELQPVIVQISAPNDANICTVPTLEAGALDVRPASMKPVTRPSHLCMLMILVLALFVCLASSHLPRQSRVRRSPRRKDPHAVGSYSHVVNPIGNCIADPILYADCYMCGKLSDNSEVYRLCCHLNQAILDFCYSLLS